jgi:hypothetical protein
MKVTVVWSVAEIYHKLEKIADPIFRVEMTDIGGNIPKISVTSS